MQMLVCYMEYRHDQHSSVTLSSFNPQLNSTSPVNLTQYSAVVTLVQISAMGDPEGNAKGGFLILDQNFKVVFCSESVVLL